MGTIYHGNGLPLVTVKINRNDPCRCGSGKKVKNCCGIDKQYYYSKLTDSQKREQEHKEKNTLKQGEALFSEIPV